MFVGLGTGCVVLLGGLYVGAVRTRLGQRTDEAALVGRMTNASVQNATNHVLDTISVTSLLLGSIALALLALSRRRPRLAVGVLAMVVGANLTSQLLKSVFLSRPDLLHRPGAASIPSFPSGHATVAMSLALGCVFVVPPRLRTITGCVSVAYAVVIGAATLTAGWHRPSDVIAAYLVATAWAAMLGALIVGSRGTAVASPPRGAPALLSRFLSSHRMLIAGAWLLGAASVLSSAVIVILNGRRLTPTRVGASYLSAMAAIVGTALVILSLLLRNLRGVLLDPPHRTTETGTPIGPSRS